MIYEPFDVVVVPFPFTDKAASKRRPALVLSALKAFNQPSGHLVLAMITGAKHSAWPLDIAIRDLESAGLPNDSVIRMKLFTLDARFVERRAGRLATTDRGLAMRSIKKLLPFEYD